MARIPDGIRLGQIRTKLEVLGLAEDFNIPLRRAALLRLEKILVDRLATAANA